MVYRLRSRFGMLWPDGVDSGTSSWFYMGIGEALLMVCFGTMVGIQKRYRHVLSIMVVHAL